MPSISIPAGYQQVMPYLIVSSAEKFLDFMLSVFDANEKMKSLKPDNTIAHAEVQLGESIIMFSSSSDQFTEQPAGLFVYVADADKTYQKALDAGAKPVMPMSDQPYGRTGGVKDPFGNTWWVTTNI